LKIYPNFSNPGLWVLTVYRYGRWARNIRIWGIRWICDRIYWILHSLVSTLTTVHLPREVKIGKCFHMIHPMSIMIHPRTVIGDHVGIMHEVTLGTKGTRGAPVIGNHVFIGAGAKIIGAVRIGDNVDIGANAVVLKDVPPDSLVVGNPGRVIEKGPGEREVPLKTEGEIQDEA